MAKRNKTAQFRVTEEEDSHLRKAAEDAGFKQLSEFLRAATLHPTIVVVDGQNVVLIPSTITLEDADERLMHRFRKILTDLQGEEPSPAPAAESAGHPPPPAPAAAPAASPSGPATPAPDSAPASPPSPGEGDGMVGKPSLQPPTPAAASRAPGPAAGAIPGPGKVLPAAPVREPGTCPNCGGIHGQHQGFCEEVRGEPPVTGTEEAPDPQPEAREQFIQRRIAEQEGEGVGTGAAQLVAEAEWRQLSSQGPAPSAATPPSPAPEQMQPCPTCGTLKLPTAQCRDCGARPQS